MHVCGEIETYTTDFQQCNENLQKRLSNGLLSHFNGDGCAGHSNQLHCLENYLVIFQKNE